MRLKETNVNIWAKIRNPMGENELFIREFIETGQKIMEVEDWEGKYANIYSCSATLSATAKNVHAGVKVRVRRGHVYLVNTALAEEVK